ncbi:PREDICTED: uncharacterized protein LOC105364814 [Ceratosolen solmsi marchali]|uniref:Uncharacterized protein LOC105364814 n=1 Tax=Ceratosolen solmsi marchali TaxID=326594 RepID=A0AAJ6YN88_9HYME|nr:PREDICTED: uncharacterized protein LOC105364814 [Ceratosolen solmsi marchali]
MKAVKKKLINGKPIVIKPPKPLDLQNKKPRQRKLVMPDPTENLEFEKYIFVSNIHDQTSIHEIKQAFPGSVTIGLIQKKVDGPRQARVKIGSSELCSYYVRNQSSWPIFHGKKVTVTYSQKKKITKKQRQMKKLNMNYHTFPKYVLDVVKDKIKNTDNTELHQQDIKINKKDSDKVT